MRIFIWFILFTGLALANPPGTFQPLLLNTGGPVQITFASSAVSSSTSSTYTFSSRSIGSTGNSRYCIIAVDGVSDTALRTISSVTLDYGTGAQAASALVTAPSSPAGAWTVTALYSVACPSGTTGTVVVTWSAAQVRTGIGIWAVYNSNGTASNTQTSTASTGSVTLNVPANGGGIAAIEGTSGGSSYSWSGLTENYDELVTSVTYHSGASLTFTAANPTLSVTATPSLPMYASAMAAASFAPQ